MAKKRNSNSSTLAASQLLVSQHSDIMYDVGTSMSNGKRLALHFDATGVGMYQEVTRTDILKLIQAAAGPIAHCSGTIEIPQIHMRDLRKLDNVFAISNEPSLVVRRQAVLINADPVRAVITRDNCFVFLPDGADSLVSLLKTCFQDQIVYSQSIAFEFAALEAVLQTICKYFRTSIYPLAKLYN
ncbi:hypothetical protein ACHHYP_20260 [Achlya hypogyna]|uniref:Uncharacterized protein n=1 Tax=Achlya hypogyna TaxID=1202772 RepID=A0A1V9YUF5_ACHHY|nr:hypothetical protein ACHHYP_20260 [Achlya hypogyna]